MLFRSIPRQCVTWLAVLSLAVAMSASSPGDVPCAGTSCEKPSAGCWYGVDGICTPNRLSHGYHQATWRRWPLDTAASGVTSPRTRRPMNAVPPAEIPDKTEEGDQTPTGQGRPWSKPPSRPEGISPAEGPAPAEDQQQPATELPDDLERDRLEDPFRDDPLFPIDDAATSESAVPHRDGQLVRYTPPMSVPSISGKIRPAAMHPTLQTPPSRARAERIRENMDLPRPSVTPLAPRRTDSGNPLRCLVQGVDRPVTVVPIPSLKLTQPHLSGGTQDEMKSLNPFRR